MRQQRGRSLRFNRRLILALAAGTTLGVGSHAAAQQVIATWAGPNGNWNDPTRWTVAPFAPNNGQGINGPTTSYYCIINSPVSVTLTSSVEIDRLDMSAGALFVQGSLTSPLINLTNSAFIQLDFGTLRNSVLNIGNSGSGLRFANNSNTLDNCTINGNVNINGAAFSGTGIRNGLTLNGQITLGVRGANLGFEGTQTLAGAGSIVFSGTNQQERGIAVDGDLTVGPGMTIRGGHAYIEGSLMPSGLINQGRIASDVAGQTLRITSLNLTNNGVLEAISGGILTIERQTGSTATWGGAGTLRAATGGVLNLNSPGSLSGMTLDTSGGTVNLRGVLNNTGSTFALGASTGSWNWGGTIEGGTVSTAPGYSLNMLAGEHATLSNTTFQGVLNANNVGRLVGDSVVWDGTLNMSNAESLTFTGTSSILGTLNTTNTPVEFAGNISFGPGFVFNRTDGSARLSGMLDNTGRTFRLDSSTGSWDFSGSITGGTVELADGNTLVGSGTLDGVTLDGQLGSSIGNWTLRNSLTGGTLSLTSTSNQLLIIDGDTTLVGATIEMLGGQNTAPPEIRFVTGGSTLTIDAASTIHAGSSRLSPGSGDPRGHLVNHGLILVDQTERTSGFYGADGQNTLTNLGTLRVENGGRFSYSQFRGDFGDVEISGAGSHVSTDGFSVAVVDQPITVQNGGELSLQGNTTVNSSITATGGSSVTIAHFNSPGPVINGSVSLTDSELFLAGPWVNNGTIALNNSVLHAGGEYDSSALSAITADPASTIRITGTVRNLNGTIAQTPAGAQILLGGGQVEGGILATSGGEYISTVPGTQSNLHIANIPGGGTQGVTLNGSLRVDGSTLYSQDFTNNGAVAVLSGGTFLLNGAWANLGTIDVAPGGILNLGGSVVLANVGTITRSGNAQVNLTGSISAPGQLFSITPSTLLTGISGNGVLTVGTLDMQTGAQLSITQNGTLRADAIMGGGTLLLNNANGLHHVEPASGGPDGGTMTIGSGVLVTGSGSLGRTMTSATSDTLVNQGTIRPAAGSGIAITSRNFVNQGLVEVNGGSFGLQVSLDPLTEGSWSNSGVIRLISGTLELGGRSTAAGLGSLDLQSGTVYLGGLLDLQGGSFSPDVDAAWVVQGPLGRIHNGTLSVGAASVEFRRRPSYSGGGIASALTIHGNVIARDMVVANGLTLNGTALMRSGDGASSVVFDGTQTIAAGNFVLDAGVNKSVQAINGAVTLGPAVEIGARLASGSGSFINQGRIYVPAGQSFTHNATIVNQGLIEALANSTLEIAPNSSWSNQGTIRAGANSTVTLRGVFTSSGSFENLGGIIDIAGTLDNTGSTLNIPASPGTFRLDGNGRLLGGTVNILPGAQLVLDRRTTLDATTINGNLVYDAINYLRLQNNVTINGQLRFTGPGAVLHNPGPHTLNIADLFFDSPVNTGMWMEFTRSASPMVFGSANVLRGGNVRIGDTFGSVPTQADQLQRIVNNGVIRADQAGQTINVVVNELVNNGVLEATNGGTLDLNFRVPTAASGVTRTLSGSGILRTNGGTIRLSGPTDAAALVNMERISGAFQLGGTVFNAGNTLELDGANESWTLTQGAAISGGTVNLLNGATLIANTQGDGGTLSGVTLNGNLAVSGGSYIVLSNGTVFNGEMTVGQRGTVEILGINNGPDVALNQGVFTLAGMPNPEQFAQFNFGNLTIGENVLIHGSGTMQPAYSRFGSGPFTFVNNGTIRADVTGVPLIVSSGSSGGGVAVLNNHGVMEAVNGGILHLVRYGPSTGELRVTDSTLILEGFDTAVLSTLQRSNASIQLAGNINNSGQTLALDPATSWRINSGAKFKGGTLQTSGTLSVGVGPGAAGPVVFEGVSVVGDLQTPIDSDARIEFRSGFTIDGSFAIRSPGAIVTFKGDQSFNGGTLFFDPSTGGPERMLTHQRLIGTGGAHITFAADSTVRGGRLRIRSRAFEPYDGSIVNFGTISADVAGSTITIEQGRFTNLGTLQAINGGVLVMDGPPPFGPDPEPFYNSGLLVADVGSAMFFGGLEADAWSTIVLRATGAESQDDYGNITADRITFGGALRVEWEGSAAPSIGDTLLLFSFGESTGVFSSMQFPQLPGDWRWDTSSMYSDGAVRVVPAPGVSVLLAMGLLGLRRRRP